MQPTNSAQTGATAAASIRLIAFDVDGVLTDGGIIIDDHGVESKRFHVRDGFAMRAAMKLGIQIAILTGRSSRVVAHRAGELGVTLLEQGCHDKAIGLENICRRAGVALEEAAFIGDDLIDLPALLRCGYPMTVADGAPEVREVAAYITPSPGGHAAARDAVEHILKAQGRWDEVLERFGV